MYVYREWLRLGLNGDMKYLSDHEPLKENPQQLSARARTAFVVARSYASPPYPKNVYPKALTTALYAQAEDYHWHLAKELEAVAEQLRQRFPDEEFLCFTDSAPILERDLAYRAGLGWFGKNTCLIHPQAGSLFFIGEILTSLELSEATHPAPVPDLCGTCDRCLKACPTQALTPRRLDANKCISYWTIEARQDAPESLRSQFADWFFGCDVCQTVCPWNEKVFGRENLQRSPAPEAETMADLRWLLTASHREIARTMRRSPLSRARPAGLKRNALLVIGNRRLKGLRAEVSLLAQKPRWRELAQWTLNQLDSN